MVQLPYILTLHKLFGLVLHPACLEELEGRWVLEGLEVPWLLSNLEALEVVGSRVGLRGWRQLESWGWRRLEESSPE